MIDQKIYSFMGLATKAGKLVSGEDSCERAVKSGKAVLVIVAGDASDNTRKKFRDACSYRNVEMRIFGSRELLGRYVGKDFRAVIAITSEDFAGRLKEMLDTGIENGGVAFGENKGL